jgi:hypothetical protein
MNAVNLNNVSWGIDAEDTYKVVVVVLVVVVLVEVLPQPDKENIAKTNAGNIIRFAANRTSLANTPKSSIPSSM